MGSLLLNEMMVAAHCFRSSAPSIFHCLAHFGSTPHFSQEAVPGVELHGFVHVELDRKTTATSVLRLVRVTD